MLAFSLAPYIQRLFQILWIFRYYGLQMVKSLNSLQLHIEKIVNKLPISLCSPSKVRNLTPSLIVNDWAFQECSFYTQSWYYHLLPINLRTCGMFQVFSEHSITFSVFFFFAPIPIFLKVLQASNSECLYISRKKKKIKLISLDIKYLFFVLYSIEYRLKRICKSHSSVYIHILHNVPTFLELGFVISENSTLLCNNAKRKHWIKKRLQSK